MLAAGVAAVAAWMDWRKGEIPNVLTLGMLALSPVLHAVLGRIHGLSYNDILWEVLYSVLGALACAVVPVILYRMNAIGGGDVKLLVALGALCQVTVGLEIEMVSFVAAALLAPAALAFRGTFAQTMKNVRVIVANSFRAKKDHVEVPREEMAWVRFGPAVFIAVLVVAWTGGITP